MLKDSYKALGQYDKAVAACQRASRMRPEDKELADECKNLSAELTMSKGKYDMDGDFRQSIRDREAQAKLYAQDRVIKTQDYRASAVEDARKEYARAPEQPKNVFNLADALADLETDEAEDEAIQLLEDAYVGRHNFNFKERAGLLRIGQLKRKLREVRKQLETQPQSDEAKSRQAELTAQLNATRSWSTIACAWRTIPRIWPPSTSTPSGCCSISGTTRPSPCSRRRRGTPAARSPRWTRSAIASS